MKNVDKNWNIAVSFIIYVNFDHAWAEHYPVTLKVATILPAIRRDQPTIVSKISRILDNHFYPARMHKE